MEFRILRQHGETLPRLAGGGPHSGHGRLQLLHGPEGLSGGERRQGIPEGLAEAGGRLPGGGEGVQHPLEGIPQDTQQLCGGLPRLGQGRPKVGDRSSQLRQRLPLRCRVPVDNSILEAAERGAQSVHSPLHGPARLLQPLGSPGGGSGHILPDGPGIRQGVQGLVQPAAQVVNPARRVCQVVQARGGPVQCGGDGGAEGIDFLYIAVNKASGLL